MAAATDAPAAPPKWKPTPDEQADLDAINAAITRMSKCTAKDPYLLEIPQDVEPRYHHNSNSRHQWLHNSPFVDGEHEITQYQTFHYYEHGKEMYVLHNSRREERASSSTRSAAIANGSSSAPKKKISLDAYRKKASGAASTPELKATKASDAPGKQAAVKGPIERVKAETEEMLAAVAEDEVPAVKPVDDAAPLNDLKRKREEIGGLKKLDNTKETHAAQESTEPSAKKAKLSDGRAVEKKGDQNGSRPARAEKARNSPDAPEENGLPPRMISPEYPPALPPRLSPGIEDKHGSSEPDETSLPKRLTPNMPENISKSLQAREKSSTASVVKSATKEKGRLSPIRKEASKITKHKSPVPRNGFRAGSSSPIRPGMEDRGRPASSMAQYESVELSQDDEIAVGKALKAKKALSTQTAELHKHSLVLKLKYKRARAADVARILRMRPSPDKSMWEADETEPSARPSEAKHAERKDAPATKGVAQRIGPALKKERKAAALQAEKQAALDKSAASAKAVAMEKQASTDKRSTHDKQGAGEKRPLPNDEKRESPTKRTKLDGNEARKEVKTPVRRELDSPAKSQLQATPTPRNNLLAAHMAQDKSQDSNTQTPPATSSTPTITSQPNGHARPPSSQPVTKTLRQKAWESEQRRFDSLGRELKHAATDLLHSSSADSAPPSRAEQKLAAVKAVESFLCYLLAFSCADEAAKAADPPQVPRLGLWRSLLGFYGFVRRNTEGSSLLFGLTSSLGVVFSSRILEIVTKTPPEHTKKEELMETQALLQRAASDADAKLDLDVLQEHFPRAWSQRTKKALLTSERLEPTKLDGPYKLPFGVATSPVRAARAGYAILQEFVEKERIEYELQLKLRSE